MGDVKDYRDLVAWQKAFQSGLRVYRETRGFPDSERFGLTSQVRRSSVSVASNIAEGYGRQSTAEYVRFLRIARGSLYEIETQLLFAVELGYMTRETFDSIAADLAECGRVLAGLIRSIDR